MTNPKIRRKQINIFKNKTKDLELEGIISLDESSFDSHIQHNYGWSKYGTKKVIIKTNKRVRYTLLCATGYKNIINYKIVKNSADKMIFLKFIKQLIRKLDKNKKYYIIMDNCRIHHSKIFKEYMKKYNNIEIIYNVPYSPESNPIEKVFSELKKYIKDDTSDKLEINKLIIGAINNIKNKNIKQYFIKSLNFYK